MSVDDTQDQYVTCAVAKRMLDIGSNAMTRLLETGLLPYKPHPFDKRIKIIKVSDIHAVLASGFIAEKTVHKRIATWTIYALVDPRTDVIRYIGRTVKPKLRLHQHLEEVGNLNPEKEKWLKELKKLKLTPRMDVLEAIECLGIQAAEREQFWIRHYLSIGTPLTNIRNL